MDRARALDASPLDQAAIFSLDGDDNNDDNGRLTTKQDVGIGMVNLQAGNVQAGNVNAADETFIDLESARGAVSPVQHYDDGTLLPAEQRWRHVFVTQPMAATIPLGLIVIWLLLFAAFPAPLSDEDGHERGNSEDADADAYYEQMAKMNTITFQDAVQGKYRGSLPSYQWTRWTDASSGVAIDGAYITTNTRGDVVVRHINANFEEKIVAEHGAMQKIDSSTIYPQSYELSHDARYLMVTADSVPRWRHSAYAAYYIFDTRAKATALVHDRGLYAAWSPADNVVAFVRDRDIFIVDAETGDEIEVTNSGRADEAVFNGVADWVYEEEVLNNVRALWWSPDGKRIAFMRFNDTKVMDYPLQIFERTRFGQYPETVHLKYPKPGTPNPVVSVHIYDLASRTTVLVELPDFTSGAPPDDRIVFDLTWVFAAAGGASNDLLVTVTNRTQDARRLVRATIDSETGVVSTTIHRHETTASWFEGVCGGRGVLDGAGMMQLALFNWTALGEEARVRYLTNGPFEVVGGVRGYDVETDLLFYLRTANNGIERVVESITRNGTITRWGAEHAGSFLDVQVSTRGSWIVLNNKGPDIPRQYLLGSNGVRRTLVDNAALKTSLALITLPAATFTNLTHPGERGLTFNAKIIHPVGFDPKRTHFYPLIVQTYNGPNSQRVTKAWSLDVHSFMASHWHEGTVSPFVDDVLLDEEQFHHRQSSGTREDDLKRFRRRTSQPPFVVLHIDVRGTGFRGEAFRSPVTGRLGETEAADIIAAVRAFVANNNYVDPEKVGFWGWSFGGFLSSKIAELDSPPNANTPSVFKACVAVAPVTHWLYYDSVYTERYMKMPKTNHRGYSETAVHNMKNFANLRYLVMHGTADDNVHYPQTLHLLRNLQAWNADYLNDMTRIAPGLYRDHFVEDDRHSMSSTPGAFWLVHRLMVDWFSDTWREVDNVRREITNGAKAVKQ